MERLNEVIPTAQEIKMLMQPATDLTTSGQGVHSDAEPLVFFPPKITKQVPGFKWEGKIGKMKVLIRLPDSTIWNGKIMIGATPSVRNEFSLDLLLSDLVLQHGYAFAACDKGTPNIILRDPNRSMVEWETNYIELTQLTQKVVQEFYDKPATHTYISGVSNGGYIARIMMERHAYLFDGGVEWEGVLWHPDSQHLLRELPIYLANYPIYRNWRGDRTQYEKNAAFGKLMHAGLHPLSEPFWEQYYMIYWIVSLWLYGFALDPDWLPFQAQWSNEWLKDPSILADYSFEARSGMINKVISSLANSGNIQKPFLSIAGNWDCLVPFEHHAKAYENLVKKNGNPALHRLYEISRGNHVDGLLRNHQGNQQPVQPYYEAAIYHLEAWVERGVQPPASAIFERVPDFIRDVPLFSMVENAR